MLEFSQILFPLFLPRIVFHEIEIIRLYRMERLRVWFEIDDSSLIFLYVGSVVKENADSIRLTDSRIDLSPTDDDESEWESFEYGKCLSLVLRGKDEEVCILHRLEELFRH